MTVFPASEREPGSIDSHLHKPEIHEDIQTFKTSLFTLFFIDRLGSFSYLHK